jgi:hypothetical protein
MKNYLKSLILVALACFGLQAQTISSGPLTGATNNLISTTGVAISVLTLFDTSGAANLMVVYDNDVVTTTNITRPAYVSVTKYSTNQISSYTNIYGVVNSITNTILATLYTTNAAATSEANRVLTAVVPANGSLTFDAATYGVLGTTRGLVIKATAAGQYLTSFKSLPY